MKFYRLEGKKIVEVKEPRSEYYEWLSRLENKNIKQTQIGDYFVSTIFLGIALNFGAKGNPVLFETIVFNKDGESIYFQRYTSYDEAVKGHEKFAIIVSVNNRRGIGADDR